MFRFHRDDYESSPFCSSLRGLEPFWKYILNALVCVLVIVYIIPAQRLVQKHCCLMKQQCLGEMLQPAAKLAALPLEQCFRATCSIPLPECLASCMLSHSSAQAVILYSLNTFISEWDINTVLAWAQHKPTPPFLTVLHNAEGHISTPGTQGSLQPDTAHPEGPYLSAGHWAQVQISQALLWSPLDTFFLGGVGCYHALDCVLFIEILQWSVCCATRGGCLLLT